MDKALLDDACEAYRRDGYVVLPGLMDAELTRRLVDTTDRLMDEAVREMGDTAAFDFETLNGAPLPVVQRIKKPHRLDPLYFELARNPAILGFVQRLIGPDVRLNHSKINVKQAQVGSPLEWHQDWAFAPHTNMSTCVASVMIDDAYVENGAMQVLPGSHLGPLHRHHEAESNSPFIGAIDPADLERDFPSARPLTGKSGTVSFHHPMTIHGSGYNRSGSPRRILFLEFAASDAWPMFYHVEWDEYNSRIVSGEPTSYVRNELVPIRLPFPSVAGSSIYKTQAAAKSRYFDTVSEAR